MRSIEELTNDYVFFSSLQNGINLFVLTLSNEEVAHIDLYTKTYEGIKNKYLSDFVAMPIEVADNIKSTFGEEENETPIYSY